MSASAVAAGVSSRIVVVGPERQVPTTFAQAQENSVVTWLKNGNYIVTWESADQDGSGDGVYARIFAANGVALSGEFLVNTTTSSSQTLPKIMTTSSGNFVAIWQDAGDIKWQLYCGAGATLGGENTLNTHLPGTQTDFRTTYLPDGGFVVSWESSFQDGSAGGAYAQRFTSQGIKIYTEFQLNTTVLNNQGNPNIAGLTNGHMVAVWDSQQNSTSDRGIYMQMFSNTNTRVGGEILVADSVGPSEADPKVVALSGGGFAVMYQHVTNGEVWVKTFSQTGAEIVGGHQLVSQMAGSTSGYSGTLTALENDRFVATWETGFGINNGVDIGYRVMKSDGTTVSTGMAHSPNNFQDMDAEVHVLPQGGFVIAFTSSDAALSGAFIARFNKNGVAIGDPAKLEVQVNSRVENYQFDSSVAVNDVGEIIVTWTSINQDGSQNDVYMQRLAAPVLGTAGADVMNGTTGDDLLSGYLGYDTINAFGGRDRLEGGRGNDVLLGGVGNDTLFGGLSADSLVGGDGTDVLEGGDGADTLLGGLAMMNFMATKVTTSFGGVQVMTKFWAEMGLTR